MSVIRYLLISFLMILLLNSCTDKLNNHDHTDSSIRWKANFRINDKDIPIIFTLDSIKLNVYGYRAIFIDGPVTHQKEYVSITDDNFTVQLDYNNYLNLKGTIKGDSIKGIFDNKKEENNTTPVLFTAHKSNETRFPLPKYYTDIDVSGQWDFIFKEKDSLPKFTLYSPVEKFYLYQKENTLLARTAKSEGFEGVMTEQGFIFSSMSNNRPTLVEVELIDQNNLKGTITVPGDTFTFTGRRKGKLESTKEDGKTFSKLLHNLFKAYKEY